MADAELESRCYDGCQCPTSTRTSLVSILVCLFNLSYSLARPPLTNGMNSTPGEPATELKNMANYSTSKSASSGPLGLDGKPHLLLSYATEEIERKDRIVEIDEEGGWIAVVPFWATWPFEIMGELFLV